MSNNGNHDFKVDGKVVGVLDNSNNLAYFHSDTPDSPLSNLYSSKQGFDLYYENHKMTANPSKTARVFHFYSVEQAFAFGKAIAMGDKENAVNIYNVKPDFANAHPSVFRRLGRNVKNFNPEVWNAQADKWMRAAMEAKFTQDPFAKKTLQAVSQFHLMEANPYDAKWGIKQNIHADHRLARGENKQGKNLMGVAEKLGYRQVQKQADKTLQQLTTQKDKNGLDMSLAEAYQDLDTPQQTKPVESPEFK